QKNRDHRKNRRVTKLRRRFNRSLCVQIVAVGVLTQYPGLHHCTGACSVGASIQPVTYPGFVEGYIEWRGLHAQRLLKAMAVVHGAEEGKGLAWAPQCSLARGPRAARPRRRRQRATA